MSNAHGDPTLAARPLSVLVCDHRGSGLAETFTRRETAHWSVHVAPDVEASLGRLAHSETDVLVLDPSQAGGAREIEAIERAGPAIVPMLLLADPARVGETIAKWSTRLARHVDVAQRGADPLEMIVRIQRLARALAADEELRALRHRADFDDRTDLLRPAAFERRLAEHWSGAQRHGYQMALVIADLDRFGRFNKRYDHMVGDEVIVRVGAAIRAALRTEDVAGRLGGDEFGFILPYTNRHDAERVVERIRERIRGVVVRVGDEILDVSASLGFETIEDRDIADVATLRRHAETALHEAKRCGGDRAIGYRTLDATPRS